ncbi:MAG: rhomboid family intramembrane serine protease [Bacteroidota bacterium]
MDQELRTERQKILNGIFFPTLFVAILWIIYFAQHVFHIESFDFGLFPRSFSRIYGIFTYQLVHDTRGIGHIFSNSVPLLVLGSIIFYFYRGIAFPVFFWVYFMTGIWLWAAGRSGTCHVGSSGLVYGFVSFLFFSGIFRWDRRLLILSMLVVFLYGSIIWGMFPITPSNVSWEGHLLGFVSGVVTAYFYRKEGPKKEEKHWDDDEEEEDSELHGEEGAGQDGTIINYEYKEKDEDRDTEEKR